MMERSITHAASNESLDALVERARAEFREMPGLRLTFQQMQRLWMLDRRTCHVLVERLLQTRVLMRTASDQYVRFGSTEAVLSQERPGRLDRRASLRSTRQTNP
ncbi:MAG: hypothetical protein EHM55_13665 [Acidobacteria bacterium]|nr:MAG: hypothetical protein EHM55_13665 [Acidobacteriota bacterium]